MVERDIWILFILFKVILITINPVCGREIRPDDGCQGGLCLSPCNDHCRSGCDVDGTCYGGCLAGWTGSQCDRPCSDYYYGANCLHGCGHCVDDAICDAISGECPGACISGFTGPLCDQGCEPYFYGNGCLSECHHCRNDQPCNRVTGKCITGCAAGWTGDKCDTVCSNKTYGIDCTSGCGHCADGEPCNHVNGVCPNNCAPGWTSEKCTSPCNPGWYGAECDFHCGHCRSGSCDRVSGICRTGCDAGWSGQMCRAACGPAMYGEGCQQQCGRCEDDLCDRVTGICTRGCDPGWEGLTCHQECTENHYGKGCTMSCGKCKDNQSCDSVTGFCPDGCTDGWEGRYCTQRQPTGEFESNPSVEVEDEFKKQSTVSLLAVVIVLLFIALSSTVIYFICIRPRRMDLASRLHRLSSVRSTEDAEPHLYEQVQAGPWEITKANLILTSEKLGTGQFGQVRKGFIKNVRSHNIPCAIKSLKLSASEKDKIDFMNELLILKKVGHHPNVVCLSGSCNIGGVLHVAMEYCVNGDLRTHMRNSRKKKQRVYSNVQSTAPMAYSTLLKFALNVACGMAHLADRQIIHRDLAARNVLLTDNFVAKVADFGLSKNDDTYVKTSKSKVPVRWLALESIFNNTYTTQSDVWSFGVLLWEIVTFGGTPYHGMDTQQFCNLLKQGYRLCRPRHCDLASYNMMVQCWQEDPLCRPDFNDIQSRLQCMVDDTQIYINIDEEMPYLNMEGVQDD